jgi:hypothetical protein
MIEDPEAAESDDAPAPRPSAAQSSGSAASTSGRGAAAGAGDDDGVRVAFQIVPAAAAVPPQGSGWKVAVAGVLLLFFVASSVQLSLVANITKLPKARRLCKIVLYFAVS